MVNGSEKWKILYEIPPGSLAMQKLIHSIRNG